MVPFMANITIFPAAISILTSRLDGTLPTYATSEELKRKLFVLDCQNIWTGIQVALIFLIKLEVVLISSKFDTFLLAPCLMELPMDSPYVMPQYKNIKAMYLS